MGVYVGHVVEAGARVLDRDLHGAVGAVARRVGGRDVRGVVRLAEAHELAVDPSVALLRVLEVLEDEEACPLAEDEAVPILVEGSARPLGGVVPLAERARLAEAREADRGQGRLGAADDHEVGVAVADLLEPHADRVVARGAGRGDREVGSLEAMADRELPGRGIDHHHRDEERRDALHALGDERAALLLRRPEAADPGAHDRAAALPVQAVEVDPGVAPSLLGGDERELDLAVEVTELSPVEVLLRIVLLHLAAEGRRVLARVEERELRRAALTLLETFPEHGHADPERGYGAQTRDHDAAHGTQVIPCVLRWAH